MSSTPESPQPQATHTITQTTTEQVANGPLQDGGVHIDLRWSRRAVAAAVLIASLAASFFTFTATQWAGSREIRRPCMIVSMRWKTGKDR